MPKYLLDTTTVSDYLRRESRVMKRLHSIQPSAIAISTITKYEIAYGLSKKPSLKKEYEEQLFVLYRKTHNLVFDEYAAETAGKIRHFLVTSGQAIGIEDILITSIALEHDLIVVTSNTKHFNRMVELNMLENWRD